MARPSKYRVGYTSSLVAHMARGYSFESFAAVTGCHRDTLYEWASRFSEFSDAKKKGEALSLLFWEGLGIQGVQGKVKGFNVAAWIFNMKNRFGWRDRQPGEEVIQREGPSHLAKYSSEQLAIGYRELDKIIKAGQAEQAPPSLIQSHTL